MLPEWNVSFRALMDAAPDGILVCDQTGTVVVVNTAAEQMFGYPRDELVGGSLERLLPEEVRDVHRGHLTAYAAEPRARAMGEKLELAARRKDGSRIPVEISLSPVTSDRGLLIIASVRDVTERRALERENQQTTAYLVSALEAVHDSFLLFDAQDRVMRINSAALHLAGSSWRVSMVGHTLEELIRHALAQGIYDLGEETAEQWLERRMAYHRNPVGSLDLRMRDGRRVRITEHKTVDGGTVTMVVDVTGEVRRAEELDAARKLAESASAAKSEFLSSMSHELRTPLNAILGFAQLLERDRKEPLSERQLDHIAHVLHGGNHLLRLIDDVLDLSRIEAGGITISPEPVDVGDVLKEVARSIDPMATRAQIEVDIRIDGETPSSVVADRTRLAQILMNFASNAIKYGKVHGHLTFHAVLATDRVRIAVRDDGIGIPEDKRDRIFEPFQRAGQEAGPIEGTGIGLTISKRLVELMHGAIGFTSEVGRGSEFWIELPADRQQTQAVAAPRRSRTTRSSLVDGVFRHRIVYVEDNPSNIAFMHALIANFTDVEMITAPNAELGIELIRAHRPDVVIMDINLPGMNGYEAAARLRDWPETARIPIIGLSAGASTTDTARAQNAGFHSYLTKPVQVDALTEVLEQLLRAD